MNIAVNGLGRIGKTFLRAVMGDHEARKKITIVAINIGPGSIADVAQLVKYDTIMGRFKGEVSISGNKLIIDGHSIELLKQMDPTSLPWKQLNIDWVVECTGHFTHREGAAKHLTAGAKKVLISAPAKGEDVNIIPGVNIEHYKSEHNIVSLGSCTTNALVPTIHVLEQIFGVDHGFMTTTHAYTNTQALIDIDIGDARRNRAAALNMVPTTTGATGMVGKIFPQLEGKLSGHAIRVPVAIVSLLDLSLIVKKPATVESIHAAFDQAARGKMKGVLVTTDEPLVSSDFAGDAHSVTIDKTLTQVIGNMIKVFGFYDNEWGYSNRMKDFLLFVAQK